VIGENDSILGVDQLRQPHQEEDLEDEEDIPRWSGNSSLSRSFAFPPVTFPPVQMPKQVILVEETLGNKEIFI